MLITGLHISRHALPFIKMIEDRYSREKEKSKGKFIYALFPIYNIIQPILRHARHSHSHTSQQQAASCTTMNGVKMAPGKPRVIDSSLQQLGQALGLTSPNSLYIWLWSEPHTL
jgi:hypothetical protein